MSEAFLPSLLAGASFGLVLVMYMKLLALASEAERTRRKLDALTQHFGIDMNAAGVEAAQKLMREGKKIEAIKAYRECTGAGLAEAKEAVERMNS